MTEVAIAGSPGRPTGPSSHLRDADLGRARLPPRELLGVALQGLRTRKLRAALSALGIAIGIGAMVAVVGVSSSAQANLIAEIDALGTNLLTVSPGTDFLGNSAVLAPSSVPMIKHMLNVNSDAPIYQVTNANVYRTPFVPAEETGGIGVDAASENLPKVVGTGLASGHFLSAVSQRYPEVVLGSEAAATLQINHVGGHVMVYLGNTWFVVVGILNPVKLDSSLDSVVFISLPVAERLFQVLPEPSEIYVRSGQNNVTSVANLLPATANPQDPSGVSVNRPSDVLEARAAAKGQFTTLLLGLGAVALLAAIGGVFGLLIGAGATEVYAATKHEPFVVPTYALIAAPCAGFLIGALAGLYPAAKAARLSPTEALRA